MNQLITLFVLLTSGQIQVSERQIEEIVRIILSGLTPDGGRSDIPISSSPQTETICGLNELARIIGTSVPTACKLSKAGKFDAARLDFGTKKLVWDKQILLEIARKKD